MSIGNVIKDNRGLNKAIQGYDFEGGRIDLYN
jgi:hypothetical protein